ncbi:MAG: hypothetical protein HQK49_14675 [Oligoflexia bacterium]|nr:hypothetical protein [Oligoflexia bacterium]
MKAYSTRPDSRGRITLGPITKGVSRYDVLVNDDGVITLKPFTEIPANEQWLFKNEKASKQVKEGLKQATARKFSKRKFVAEEK